MLLDVRTVTFYFAQIIYIYIYRERERDTEFRYRFIVFFYVEISLRIYFHWTLNVKFLLYTAFSILDFYNEPENIRWKFVNNLRIICVIARISERLGVVLDRERFKIRKTFKGRKLCWKWFEKDHTVYS